MQLLKTRELFLPHCYPHEIKGNKLEYFIRGEGWKKTKVFDIVNDVTLPERDSAITWLQIAALYNKYGIEVANTYAERKTAGIVSRQTAMGYGITYGSIKDVIPENFDSNFFECLSIDYMCACMGYYLFDIIATDKKLSSLDSDYNSNCATYKGEKCSMKEYITIKYGTPYVAIIEKLNKS
jgi:hypothetical protein